MVDNNMFWNTQSINLDCPRNQSINLDCPRNHIGLFDEAVPAISSRLDILKSRTGLHRIDRLRPIEFRHYGATRETSKHALNPCDYIIQPMINKHNKEHDRRLSRGLLLRKSQKEMHITILISYHSRLVRSFGRDIGTSFRDFADKSIRICYTRKPNVQELLNLRFDLKSSKQCNDKRCATCRNHKETKQVVNIDKIKTKRIKSLNIGAVRKAEQSVVTTSFIREE
ncbi:hypothetical protein GJ496_009384 [Pomphorhynchus laevis]|nr:hypothetical protein GJ496_009384 [Pomphorhynchus laevis]